MEKSNIVLIGMPLCGKTTIGKELVSLTNKNFIDIDNYIEEKWGKISDLFINGEDYFRDIESKAVKEVSNLENYIISTGGGVILREENILNLKTNGIIIFIDRPLEILKKQEDKGDRPLLKKNINAIEELYNKRINLYNRYCDYKVINNSEGVSLVAKNIFTYLNRLYKINKN